MPVGLSDVSAIAASGSDIGYSFALKNDGTVVVWGGGSFHTNVIHVATDVPTGLNNVVAIAAGYNFCLAITTNSAVADKFRH